MGTSTAASGGTERRSLCRRRAQGQRVIVQFDGAYMDSTVYMNGTQICARPYGFISYECDFTSSAKFGGLNVLAVRLNNQQPSSRWYSGSGIFRHTWLKTVNPLRVAYTGTHVSTPQVSADQRHRERLGYAPKRRGGRSVRLGRELDPRQHGSPGSSGLGAGHHGRRRDDHHPGDRHRDADHHGPEPEALVALVSYPLLDGHDGHRRRRGGRHVYYFLRHSHLRVRREQRLYAERSEREAQRHVQSQRPGRTGRRGELPRHREAAPDAQGHGRERTPHVAQPARARVSRHRRPPRLPRDGRGLRLLGPGQEHLRLRSVLQPVGHDGHQRHGHAGSQSSEHHHLEHRKRDSR